MSKVEIEIPDDGWFSGDDKLRPQDKQLCIVIQAFWYQIPWIYQYRKADKLFKRGDYFLDVSDQLGTKVWGTKDWKPGIFEWYGVDRWKPLALPEDVNSRILDEIEYWFEGDD